MSRAKKTKENLRKTNKKLRKTKENFKKTKENQEASEALWCGPPTKDQKVALL